MRSKPLQCWAHRFQQEPILVAECMAAIRAAVKVRATVKCRIGVDDQDPAESLFTLVDLCAQAGRHGDQVKVKELAELIGEPLRPLAWSPAPVPLLP